MIKEKDYAIEAIKQTLANNKGNSERAKKMKDEGKAGTGKDTTKSFGQNKDKS